jgi:multicomponent K+:H+ antiporter subunit E
MSLLPYPLLSLSFFVLWMALAQSVSPGQIALGLLVALVGGWSLRRLAAPRARMRRPAAFLRLATRLLIDMVGSCVSLSGMILSGRTPRQAFVVVPLTIRSQSALALLAVVITATPGTVWVSFDEASGELTLHVVDLDDAGRLIASVKERYEAPIREIFE